MQVVNQHISKVECLVVIMGKISDYIHKAFHLLDHHPKPWSNIDFDWLIPVFSLWCWTFLFYIICRLLITGWL